MWGWEGGKKRRLLPEPPLGSPSQGRLVRVGRPLVAQVPHTVLGSGSSGKFLRSSATSSIHLRCLVPSGDLKPPYGHCQGQRSLTTTVGSWQESPGAVGKGTRGASRGPSVWVPRQKGLRFAENKPRTLEGGTSMAGVGVATPEGNGKGPCSLSLGPGSCPPPPGDGSAAGGQASCPRKASLSKLLIPFWSLRRKEVACVGRKASGVKGVCGVGGPSRDHANTTRPSPPVSPGVPLVWEESG